MRHGQSKSEQSERLADRRTHGQTGTDGLSEREREKQMEEKVFTWVWVGLAGVGGFGEFRDGFSGHPLYATLLRHP